MTTISTAAPRAHYIDPKTFLDYFTACGGGYCLTPDGQLQLGILQTGDTNPNRTIATQILRELTPNAAARIKGYLIALENGANEIADNWSAAMTRFRIAENEYLAVGGDDCPDADRQDELCEIMSDARWALIRMPAPDRTALLWKLEYLFEGSNGSLDPYNLDHLSQVVADFRRLLVEA